MTSEGSGESFSRYRLGAKQQHKAFADTGGEDPHWRKQKCVYGTVYFSCNSNSWMKELIERTKVIGTGFDVPINITNHKYGRIQLQGDPLKLK
jgi:hypothetical protein